MRKFKKHIIKILSKQRIRRNVDKYNKKIDRIILPENSLDLGPQIVRSYKKKWGELYDDRINPKWLYLFGNSTGIKSPDFVPESIYYSIIEPVLNKSEFSKSYSDKNFYDLFYNNSLFPEVLLRNIDGSFLGKDYQPVSIISDADILRFLNGIERFILKPSVESGGGNNVELFTRNGDGYFNTSGDALSVKWLKQVFKENYLLQPVLQQHEFLSQFNPTSVNTIKTFTYRSPVTNEIKNLHFILRIGAKNLHVDNTKFGGVRIGINKNGTLNNFAVDGVGTKLFEINSIDLGSEHLQIPFFDKVKQLAVEIARRNIHHRVLGLDIMIDSENNIRCLEINNFGNGIEGFQYCNGPLFGEFTDEVIEYCRLNKYRLYRNYNF